VSSVAIFFAIRLLLHFFYVAAAGRWPFLRRRVEAIRRRGSPLVEKHGFGGLVLFVAIPLPTTGVYAGAMLSWLLGMKWQASLLAVVLGAATSNGLVTLSTLGIAQAIG
jgi:uncharacterized membrane protein